MNISGFIVAAVLLTLLPGPDILLVTTQSIMRGARTGVVFAAGLCTGIIFHTSIVAFGLSPIITSSPTLFTIVKFCGASYLIYLGIKSFLARDKASFQLGENRNNATAINENSPELTCSSGSGNPQSGSGNHTSNCMQYYKRGVIMNVLNPKVILFFLALFPQFITVHEGNSSIQFLTLGAIFMAQAFIIFSGVAFCAGKLSRFIIGNKKIAYILCIAEASIFTVLGVSIIFI
ncbi:MAG: LysE family translocator [Bacteroidales bacterium]